MGAFLMALAGPLARQVMIALGLGVVSFVGLDQALSALVAQAKAAWSGNTAIAAAFLSMSGINTGVSIIVGAITARLALAQLKRIMPK